MVFSDYWKKYKIRLSKKKLGNTFFNQEWFTMVISGDYTHSFFLSNPKDLCQKSPIWKLGCDHVNEVKQKTHKSELGAAKKDW